jgi:hypothetical protein
VKVETSFGELRKPPRLTGESHPNSKLTWELVRRARALYETGSYSQKEIAHLLDLKYHLVHDLLKGKTWKESRFSSE